MNRATCRTLLERQVAFCRITFIQSFYFCLKVSHIFGQIFFILKIVIVGIGADLYTLLRLDELHIGKGSAACQHQQQDHDQQTAAALFLQLLRFRLRLCRSSLPMHSERLFCRQGNLRSLHQPRTFPCSCRRRAFPLRAHRRP